MQIDSYRFKQGQLPFTGVALAEAKECVVCLEKEGFDSDGSAVVMREIRCAHDVCMECFACLDKKSIYDCPECRRPIIARPVVVEDMEESSWVTHVEYCSGVGLRVIGDVAAVFYGVKSLRRGGVKDLDKHEIADITLDEIASNRVCKLLYTLLFSEERVRGERTVLYGPSKQGHEDCSDYRISSRFEQQIRELITSIADRINLRVSRLKVLSHGESKPILSQEELGALNSLVKQQLGIIVESLARRHVCRRPSFETRRREFLRSLRAFIGDVNNSVYYPLDSQSGLGIGVGYRRNYGSE